MGGAKMREMIRPGLVLMLITVVAALCLGAAYAVTKEPIEKQLIQTKNASMQKIMPDADDFEEIEVNPGYEANSVYAATSQGDGIGYVIGLKVKGYGGDIDVLAAIDVQGTIVGVDIVNHSETPGLGAKADSDAYLSQYKNKTQFLTVVKSAAGDNDVQAVTSATITSNAVTTAVNSALDYFNVYLKGAN